MEHEEQIKLASAIAVAILIDEGKPMEAATLAHTCNLDMEYCLFVSNAYKAAIHTLGKFGDELVKVSEDILAKERA